MRLSDFFRAKNWVEDFLKLSLITLDIPGTQLHAFTKFDENWSSDFCINREHTHISAKQVKIFNFKISLTHHE